MNNWLIGALVWGGVAIINVVVLLRILSHRKAEAVTGEDVLIAAFVSDLIVHALAGIVEIGELPKLLMWLPLSFIFVFICSWPICLVAGFAWEYGWLRRSH